jgi:hypothetical protein
MDCFQMAVSAAAVLMVGWVSAAQAQTNVALGATVSVAATDPDPNAGYNNNTFGNLQNITNGTILPDATGYNTSAATNQALEWNGGEYVFQITLNGTFNINGIIVDADDNDEYNFQYYNLTTQTWDAFYTAPIVSVGFGIRTRPNTADQNQIYSLPSSILTTAIRVSGGYSDDNGCFDGTCNQGGYALAQVELFGTPYVPPVPEPGSVALVGVGLVGLAGVRRARKGARGRA